MRIFFGGILLFLITLLNPVYADTVMKCTHDSNNLKKFLKVNPKKKIFYERVQGQWKEIASDLCPSPMPDNSEVITTIENRSKTALYSQCVWETSTLIEKKGNPILCNRFKKFTPNFTKEEFEKKCILTETGGYVPTVEYKKKFFKEYNKPEWETSESRRELLIDFRIKQFSSGYPTFDCEIVK